MKYQKVINALIKARREAYGLFSLLVTEQQLQFRGLEETLTENAGGNLNNDFDAKSAVLILDAWYNLVTSEFPKNNKDRKFEEVLTKELFGTVEKAKVAKAIFGYISAIEPPDSIKMSYDPREVYSKSLLFNLDRVNEKDIKYINFILLAFNEELVTALQSELRFIDFQECKARTILNLTADLTCLDENYEKIESLIAKKKWDQAVTYIIFHNRPHIALQIADSQLFEFNNLYNYILLDRWFTCRHDKLWLHLSKAPKSIVESLDKLFNNKSLDECEAIFALLEKNYSEEACNLLILLLEKNLLSAGMIKLLNKLLATDIKSLKEGENLLTIEDLIDAIPKPLLVVKNNNERLDIFFTDLYKIEHPFIHYLAALITTGKVHGIQPQDNIDQTTESGASIQSMLKEVIQSSGIWAKKAAYLLIDQVLLFNIKLTSPEALETYREAAKIAKDDTQDITRKHMTFFKNRLHNIVRNTETDLWLETFRAQDPVLQHHYDKAHGLIVRLG